jgi:hypothetical protein
MLKLTLLETSLYVVNKIVSVVWIQSMTLRKDLPLHLTLLATRTRMNSYTTWTRTTVLTRAHVSSTAEKEKEIETGTDLELALLKPFHLDSTDTRIIVVAAAIRKEQDS